MADSRDDSPDPAVAALLSQVRLTPIYGSWLAERDRQLSARLSSLALRPARILLVNATLGLTLYPSIVDFFLALRRERPAIHVTSTSYFEEIFQLSEEVARRGLPIARVTEVMSWSKDQIDRYDLVIAIGPSEILARLMSLEGLRSKLVLLDLAFYHQLIASQPAFLARHPGAFLAQPFQQPVQATAWPTDGLERRGNAIPLYTCQPFEKVKSDSAPFFPMSRFLLHRFNYIPLGFGRREYYRSSERLFDVALLGTNARNYSLLDPSLLAGLRFLFLGRIDDAEGLAPLRATAQFTAIPRVDEREYGMLLALCRIVVMPVPSKRDNVFLSVVDALATGLPIVASRRPGFEELQRDGAPVLLYAEQTGGDWWSPSRAHGVASTSLAGEVRRALGNEAYLSELGERAIRYTKERLDIYRILERIVEAELT